MKNPINRQVIRKSSPEGINGLWWVKFAKKVRFKLKEKYVLSAEKADASVYFEPDLRH